MSKIKSGLILAGQLFTGKYPLRSFLYYYFARNQSGGSLLHKILNKSEWNSIYRSSGFVPVKLDDSLYLGQANHPDVLTISDGKTEKILLVATAYPYNDDRFENICLYESYDGINFFSPGAKNPIAEYVKPIRLSHLSDPDIIEVEGKYWLYYRDCFIVGTERRERILKKTSMDLTEWSEPELVLDAAYHEAISPSVVKIGGKYHMYYVNYTGEKSLLQRRVSPDGFFIGSVPETLCVEKVPSGKNLWHIDICYEQGGIYGLVALSEDPQGRRSRLYCAFSEDEGSTWTIGREISVCDGQEKYFKRIYRSSMTTAWGRRLLYVSVMTRKNSWYIYRIDNFIPDLYRI